jgi:transposase
VKVHRVGKCQYCQKSLRKVKVEGYEKRQVFDLPVVRIQVKEHRVEVKRCVCCGKESKGIFPEDVTQPVQYGAEIKAQAVYLNQYQMLPLERVSDVFEDFYGHRLAEGTIVETCQEAAKRVLSVNQAIKKYLTTLANVVNFDETGLRIQSKLYWLHVACTSLLTYYEVHAKRGQEAMKVMGILPDYRGTAVHDGLKSYWKYDQAQHGLCNEHHLRELEFIGERYPQEWVGKFADLLMEIKTAVDLARGTQLCLREEQLAEFCPRLVKMAGIFSL